jgi:hypothetical protein
MPNADYTCLTNSRQCEIEIGLNIVFCLDTLPMLGYSSGLNVDFGKELDILCTKSTK